MTTSTERSEGTSNVERITAELQVAVVGVPERFAGYRQQLVDTALECYLLTAEHDEQRININQKYDAAVRAIAAEIGRHEPRGAK